MEKHKGCDSQDCSTRLIQRGINGSGVLWDCNSLSSSFWKTLPGAEGAKNLRWSVYGRACPTEQGDHWFRAWHGLGYVIRHCVFGKAVWESAVNQVCLYFFCFLSNLGVELTTCSSHEGMVLASLAFWDFPWGLEIAHSERQNQGGETHGTGSLLLCLGRLSDLGTRRNFGRDCQRPGTVVC